MAAATFDCDSESEVWVRILLHDLGKSIGSSWGNLNVHVFAIIVLSRIEDCSRCLTSGRGCEGTLSLRSASWRGSLSSPIMAHSDRNTWEEEIEDRRGVVKISARGKLEEGLRSR